jgi:tetratricopeptide (TPR) repeat protein
MAEISLEEVPKNVQGLFNKGFSAFERGNLDYAVDLLLQCVELEPRLLRARKFLRAAEVQKFKGKKESAFSRGLSSMKGAPALLGSLALSKGHPEKAVMAAEKLLKDDPVNPKYVKAFAEAAASAGLPEAAIQTLEIARDHNPEDISLLNWLGKIYALMGDTAGARRCFESVCELAPNDPAAVKILKDAMALDTISTDGWIEASEEGGSYRDLIKDTDEATLLEQEAKAVKSEDDVAALIAETVAKIEEDPNNINFYRALARLYVDQKAYDDAIETLLKALEMNPGDPEIDDNLSRARLKKYDHQVAELRAAGDEDAAQALQTERDNYVFNDLQERVARYPNDMSLRYDWGAQLLLYEYFDEAIQQFQLSQRYPKRRIKSLLNMALCFKKKNIVDMAKAQLELALSEMTVMSQGKKDVLYELGIMLEEAGDMAKAGEFYKQIYQVDISYKDISKKVESLYK